MKYLILGNGPTGVIAAETLRKADPAGEIVMAGSEPEPPYSRMAIPYLLEGNIDESGTYLRKSADHFAKLRITPTPGPRRGAGHGKRACCSTTAAGKATTACWWPPARIRCARPSPAWTCPRCTPAGRSPTRARSPRLPSPARACCNWAPASSAASSWRRWRNVRRAAHRGGDGRPHGAAHDDAQGRRHDQALGGGRRASRCAPRPAWNASTRAQTAPLLVKLTTGETLPCDLLIVAAGVAPNVELPGSHPGACGQGRAGERPHGNLGARHLRGRRRGRGARPVHRRPPGVRHPAQRRRPGPGRRPEHGAART
jgi:hypothetical protein